MGSKHINAVVFFPAEGSRNVNFSNLQYASIIKGQRRRLDLIVLACMFFVATLSASAVAETPPALHDHLRHDYRWWASLSAQSKAVAIESAINGIEMGWIQAFGTAQVQAANYLSAHGDVPRARISEFANQRIQDAPRFSRTTAYYRTKIDAFYRIAAPARVQDFVIPLYFCLADDGKQSCESVAQHPGPRVAPKRVRQ